MTRPFTLRRARAEDVDAVHRIHTTAIREGAADHYSPEAIDAWVGAFNPARFPENMRRMDFFVVELPDGRLAGFVTLDPEGSELESMYVAPWGHGKGLGSYLLGFAEGLARERGLSRLWLDASLNAVGFYARHQWTEVRRHARVRDGVEIQVVKMEKEVTGPEPA
jgi:putative acetyltransferase